MLLYVRVAELVDAPGLGPGGATRGSSSLPPDTINSDYKIIKDERCRKVWSYVEILREYFCSLGTS